MCVKMWLRIQQQRRQLSTIDWEWPTLPVQLGKFGYVANELCFGSHNITEEAVRRGLICPRDGVVDRHIGVWKKVRTRSIGLTRQGELLLHRIFGQSLPQICSELVGLCGEVNLDSHSLGKMSVNDILEKITLLDNTAEWSHTSSIFRNNDLRLRTGRDGKQLRIEDAKLQASIGIGPVRAGLSARPEVSTNWKEFRKSYFVKNKQDDSQRFRFSIRAFRRHARLRSSPSLAGEFVEFFALIRIVGEKMWRGRHVYVAKATDSLLEPFDRDNTISLLIDAEGIRQDLGNIVRAFDSYLIEVIGVVLPERDERDREVPLVGVVHLTLFQELSSDLVGMLRQLRLKPVAERHGKGISLDRWLGLEEC